MKFLLLYIFIIFLTNLGFSYVPPIDIGFGLFSPMAIVAGAVFVARDFAQRESGNYVLIAMLVGCGLSYAMANPYVATASVLSFAISELLDWLVFTATKKPFYKRIMISSLIATPIDSLVFLAFIDILTPMTFVLMVLSKLIVALGVYLYGKEKGMA